MRIKYGDGHTMYSPSLRSYLVTLKSLKRAAIIESSILPSFDEQLNKNDVIGDICIAR